MFPWSFRTPATQYKTFFPGEFLSALDSPFPITVSSGLSVKNEYGSP
jgi:hypothetical protein